MSSSEPVDVHLSSPEPDIVVSSTDAEAEKESEQEAKEFPPIDPQKEVQED